MSSSATDLGVDLRLSEAELETTRNHIVEFIADRAEAAGVDRGIIGLSGGIDSTVTAYLARDALGGDAIHGLVMPSTVNQDDNMSDAERIAQDLGIGYDVIEIEPITEAVLDAFPDLDGGQRDREPLRTAIGNVRVRIRAVLNYLAANTEGALVIGTGNRTEALVGYFTKYGDGAVDCHPIGNLYKQQVRQLARFMGVSEDIVTKTPTAGLWAGQTDEGELGLPYETLDAILALSIDGSFSPAATARLLDGVTETEVDRIRQLHDRSEHKRQIPPAPTPQW